MVPLVLSVCLAWWLLLSSGWVSTGPPGLVVVPFSILVSTTAVVASASVASTSVASTTVASTTVASTTVASTAVTPLGTSSRLALSLAILAA